jgi:hypothetical protein
LNENSYSGECSALRCGGDACMEIVRAWNACAVVGVRQLIDSSGGDALMEMVGAVTL